jgi:hypothetical protein
MAKRSCPTDRNQKWCNCTYDPCARKGLCCDCLHYHLQAGELPACVFPDDAERSYDRSIENFVKLFQERGKWWEGRA